MFFMSQFKSFPQSTGKSYVRLVLFSKMTLPHYVASLKMNLDKETFNKEPSMCVYNHDYGIISLMLSGFPSLNSLNLN